MELHCLHPTMGPRAVKGGLPTSIAPHFWGPLEGRGDVITLIEMVSLLASLFYRDFHGHACAWGLFAQDYMRPMGLSLHSIVT